MSAELWDAISDTEGGADIYQRGGPFIGFTTLMADGVRIAEAHNALAGLQPAALGDLLSACDDLIRDHAECTMPDCAAKDDVRAALAALRSAPAETAVQG